MLAAAIELGERLPAAAAVLGAGCDGELEPSEVLDRIAALARAGAWTGTWSVPPAIADEIEAAAAETQTEASLQVVRCARGETGMAEIRGGRRHVPLSPLGALAFYFDPVAGAPALPLASAVVGSHSLEEAHAALTPRACATELDYERGRAAESP